MTDYVTIHRGPLEGRRIDFDADSRSIIVDDSQITDDDIEDVARLAALAVSALVPGITMTGEQAAVIVRVIMEIVDMAREGEQ